MLLSMVLITVPLGIQLATVRPRIVSPIVSLAIVLLLAVACGPNTTPDLARMETPVPVPDVTSLATDAPLPTPDLDATATTSASTRSSTVKPTPSPLYPNRPGPRPTDIELRLQSGQIVEGGAYDGFQISVFDWFQCQSLDRSSGQVRTAAQGNLLFLFMALVKNSRSHSQSIVFPAAITMLTPLGNEEQPLSGLNPPVKTLSEEIVELIEWEQIISSEVAANQVFQSLFDFEAVNVPGTYYIILDMNGSPRVVWGYVHDGLSDGC